MEKADNKQKASFEALFAQDMKSFEGYVIGKMLAYINDPKIISFAGGLPSSEVFPLDIIHKAAKKSLGKDWQLTLQYSSIPGEKELLEAAVDYLRRDGISIGPENIIITTSGQHGLDLVGRLFLDSQDYIVIDLPTFGGALSAFELEVAQYIGRDIQEDGSDVEGMEQGMKELLAKGKKPKFIYVVPDFQNPSGITISLEKRLSLLSLSKKYGIPLVEDSPYRELRYKGKNIPSIYSLDKNQGNVIGVYTFSKILCPGIRVGFNIGPPEIIKKFNAIKSANILNTPKLNQDICTTFLRECDLDAHFKKAVGYYSQKLDFFLKAMEENFSEDMAAKWTKPEGGLFLWVEVPEEINTLELLSIAIEEKVAFVPGEVFYPKGFRKYNTMRVNFSYPTKDEIIEGVKRLSSAIKKYKARKKSRG